MCTKFLLEASNDLLSDVSATERSVLGVSELGPKNNVVYREVYPRMCPLHRGFS